MSFVGDAEAIAQRLTVTRAQPSKVLSLLSAVLLVLWIIVTVFFFYVVVVTVKRHIPRLLMLFHGGVAWLFGMRIHVRVSWPPTGPCSMLAIMCPTSMCLS